MEQGQDASGDRDQVAPCLVQAVLPQVLALGGGRAGQVQHHREGRRAPDAADSRLVVA